MIPLPLLTGETRQLSADVRETPAILRVIAVLVTQIVESAVAACYVQLAVAPCPARLTPARSAALQWSRVHQSTNSATFALHRLELIAAAPCAQLQASFRPSLEFTLAHQHIMPKASRVLPLLGTLTGRAHLLVLASIPAGGSGSGTCR